MREKLISIIEEEIKIQNKKIEKEKQDVITPFKELKSQLQTVISAPLTITVVDIDMINDNLKCLDNETIKKVKLYQKLTSLVNFPLNEEQKNDIKNIMNTICTKIDEIIKIISVNNNSKVKEYNKEIEELTILKEKIASRNSIESKDIDLIVELLNKNNTNLRERMDIITDLTITSIDELTKENTVKTKEEVFELVPTNLDRETVEVLFKSYGLNFDDFSKDEQNKIIKYGNLERMESIITAFRNNHIFINLGEKSKQIQEILVNSTGEIVEIIINNIKTDINSGTPEDGQIIDINNAVQMYINNPALFINGNRNYPRNNKKGIHVDPPRGGKPADIIGAFQNYTENRRIFIELGIDMHKPSTAIITMLAFSNNKIKENIANYDFYGIPREKYTKTISCLRAPEPLSTIDQYIELGYYRYMINNLSMVIRKKDDIMFYRIVKAFQHGCSPDELYYNKEKPTLYGEITNPNSHKYGLTEENKQSEVEQYLPDFSSKYDEIIESSRNSGPLSLVKNDEMIKKLEVYKEDELRYNFNGIIISRMKVLRIYETLLKNLFAGTVTSIKYAICKNSILTEVQYRTIEECLDRIYNESKGVGSR